MVYLMIGKMALNFLRSGSLRGRNTEKADAAPSSPMNKLYIPLWIARLLQFVLGITIIGLYGQDLNNARKAGKYVDSKWAYAVAIGSISAFVSLIFALPKIKPWMFFAVDAVIWLLYLVAFGIFGKMYISEDPEGNKGIQRMKNAVWVLLTNLLLWFGTAVAGAFVFWRVKKTRSPSVV